MINIKKHWAAFTLAEVLITLLIIGVVACITIPALLESTKKQELVTALQKEYSTFSQAYNLLLAENGDDITSVFTGTSDSDDAKFIDTLATKLKLQKNCGTSMGCAYATPRYYLNGTQQMPNFDLYYSGHYGKAILSDGSMFFADIWSVDCSFKKGTSSLKICGDMGVDVNGAKGPNTVGKDYFHFWITPTGIYPMGIDNNDSTSCDATTANLVTNKGCTAKVITEGKIDY